MILHTKFDPGDRVRYVGKVAPYWNEKRVGDLFTITAVHVRAHADGGTVHYSARIDDAFIPRLESQHCTIRVFNIPEHELEAE